MSKPKHPTLMLSDLVARGLDIIDKHGDRPVVVSVSSDEGPFKGIPEFITTQVYLSEDIKEGFHPMIKIKLEPLDG